MKYPSHIILDTANAHYYMSVGSWVTNFAKRVEDGRDRASNLNLYARFLAKPNSVELVLKKKQHKTAVAVTSGDKEAFPESVREFLTEAPSAVPSRFASTFLHDFDVNLLRKEKIYTKLKYSRCPQYDIVSGGVAAILAGFIGFLICEKFGLELLDSGDFYFAFMYAVIICFSMRPILRSINRFSTVWNFWSPKFAVVFYQDTLTMLLKSLSSLVMFRNGRLFVWAQDFVVIAKDLDYATIIYKMIYNAIQFLKNYPVKNYPRKEY